MVWRPPRCYLRFLWSLSLLPAARLAAEPVSVPINARGWLVAAVAEVRYAALRATERHRLPFWGTFWLLLVFSHFCPRRADSEEELRSQSCGQGAQQPLPSPWGPPAGRAVCHRCPQHIGTGPEPPCATVPAVGTRVGPTGRDASGCPTTALPHCVAMALAEQPSAGLRPRKTKHNLSDTAFNSYFLGALTRCVCPFLTVRTTPTPAAHAASFMSTLYFSILQISTLFRQNFKHSGTHSGQPDSSLETSSSPPSTLRGLLLLSVTSRGVA